MPSTCAVPFCSERSGGHKFPRDKNLREKWIVAIRRVNFQPSEYAKVCKKHFRKDDYRLPKDSSLKYPVNVLKKDAVPSKFSWNEKKVDKEQSTEKKILSGQRCSVLQCKSGSAKNILLHSCPNHEAVRKKWAEVFKVNREVVKNMLICSQHFLNTDYLSSKKGDTRILKQNAVPSQKLPRSTRIISVRKKVLHCKNKNVRTKPIKKEEKMSDAVDEESNVNQQENVRECRACLKRMDSNISACFIFQCWVPPWTGMEATIAQDLAKLANVEIMETDNHSKIICEPCYCKLLDASKFVANVRFSDQILKRQIELDHADKVWPKPIQIDKNINSNVFHDMNIEIKQEIVSDEDYTPNITENSYAPNAVDNSYPPENTDPEFGNLDIKVEPEEFVEPPSFEETTPFVEPPPLTITINGTMSLKSNPENKTLVNGTDDYEAIITEDMKNTALPDCNGGLYNEQHLEATVKEEPPSEEEDYEQGPDLSLECLLCTKLFNCVTGLKAHVIAHHSYKSVKRKALNSQSPEKKFKDEYQCQICRRTFLTSTDLMVHETCHNKHSCYGCTRKFDTFKQLSKHRKRCNLPLNKPVVKPKTLDDVKSEGKNAQIKRNIGQYGARSNYTHQKLETVLERVRRGNLSLSAAGAKYGIPRSTLTYKLHHKHERKIGKPTAFSDEEENMFVQYILEQSENRTPIRLKDFRIMIRDYLNENRRTISIFSDNMPGAKWGRAFLKRHPILKYIKCGNMEAHKRPVKEENIGSPDLSSSVDKNGEYLNDSSMKLHLGIISSENETPIVKQEIEDPDETDSHMEILQNDFTQGM